MEVPVSLPVTSLGSAVISNCPAAVCTQMLGGETVSQALRRPSKYATWLCSCGSEGTLLWLAYTYKLSPAVHCADQCWCPTSLFAVLCNWLEAVYCHVQDAQRWQCEWVKRH